MKVIPFPNRRAASSDKSPKNAQKDIIYRHIGPFSFTCPYCRTVINFESVNLVFLVLEFFCGGCGHKHKISNPVVEKQLK